MLEEAQSPLWREKGSVETVLQIALMYDCTLPYVG